VPAAQKFALNSAFPYTPSRSGTAIYGIVTTLQALNRPFTYSQFELIVAQVLGWQAGSRSFSVASRFKSLRQATDAWLYELLNKRRPILIRR
jgi:hypothetical protein